MGLFDKLKKKSEAPTAEAQQVEFATKRAEWDAWADELLHCLELAKGGGSTAADDPDGLIPLMLKAGEQVFTIAQGAGLVEPRRLPGQWVGRSQGVSVRIAKGLTYRVGANRGTYQQGAEVPTAIDFGTITVTNQRVVFQGAKQTREWLYSKMLGFQHDPDAPVTYLQVSNRQKTSGFLYDEANAPKVRLRLAVALAWADGDASEVVPVLQEMMTEHRASLPPGLPVEADDPA